MPGDLYKPKLWVRHHGIISHEEREMERHELPKSPIIDAFMADDDIQEITICSSNIGFYWVIRKQYKEVDDAG